LLSADTRIGRQFEGCR